MFFLNFHEIFCKKLCGIKKNATFVLRNTRNAGFGACKL